MEVQAISSYLPISPQKLRLVIDQVRGMGVQQAVITLQFMPKKGAEFVQKALKSAIANAENNHQLDVDRLYVAEAFVGKGLVMKRLSARARGRAARIEKPFSNLTVIVRERAEEIA